MALAKVQNEDKSQELQVGLITAPVGKSVTREKTVLDEDTYEKNLEKIIQRDFFPDLEKMRAQKEYIEAAERNDKEKMRELMIKYRRKTGLPTPSVAPTPATFETPSVASVTASPPREKSEEGIKNDSKLGEGDDESINSDVKDNKNVKPSDLPLDKYLSNYKSEDTESFESLMKESERKQQVKYSWLFEQEKEHEARYHDQLALPSCETQAITDTNSRSGGADNWTYQARNAVMYVPQGMELSVAERLEVVKKKDREIVHDNTRFSSKPFDETAKQQAMHQAAATQAQANQGRIGVDGKELIPKETPNVAGFSFVATPSPAPGLTEESPLMTWGEIEGTPFRLDSVDTHGALPLTSAATPQFKMPAVPRRDSLAFSLAEKASAQHRRKKEEALKKASATFSGGSPSPGGGSSSHKSLDRLQHMSPAAQRLASSKLGVRLGTGGDRALRESYTPSPGHRHTTSDSPHIISSYRSTCGRTSDRRGEATPGGGAATPSCGGGVRRRQTPGTGAGSSLTDDLLNIPEIQAVQPQGGSERKQRRLL